MQRVVLTGGHTALGRRVLDLMGDDPEVERVVVATDGPGPELKRSFEGVSALVHLVEDPAVTRAVLDAAGATGIDHVVVLSSATVYGAWATNPVPLTEQAPLRPNPELTLAVRAAERERLAGEWKSAHPGTTVAVLRPALTVTEQAGPEESDWLARSLRAATGPIDAGDDPPSQYLHLDDLASAIDHARRHRLDGPYNVAPDGWLTGDAARALSGGPRVTLPDRIADRAAPWRWRVVRRTSPPGVAAYARHPWVVANDRLRATGWAPQHTNEAASVAASRPTPWATVSPRRRQQLALAGAGLAAAALAAGGVAAVRALVRRSE